MSKTRMLKRCSAVEGNFSYLVAVIGFLVMMLISSAVVGGMEEGGAPREVVSFLINSLIQFVFLVTAVQPFRLFGSRPTYYYSKIKPKYILFGAIVAVVSIIGFEALALAFNYGLISLGYQATGVVSFGSALAIVLNAVRVILIAPVCEETLLRGSLLSSLGVTCKMSERARIPFMVITCGLLFALLHMNPLQTVYQFLFGCALAYITIRFGNIIIAIVAHAVNNAIGFILSIPVIDGGITAWMNSVFAEWWGVMLWIVVGIVLAIVAFFILRFIGRKFGGLSPVSPTNEAVKEGEFVQADDGGTYGGVIIAGVGAVICLIMWIATLLTSFAV
ncbi:MAG: CPBP family intramembrane metalloprotease [Clostridia bacterium]|nr:CPBP family intramembrane metalloprotease [Clostridia bacterium]